MRCEFDIVYVIDPEEAVHDALTALLGATGTQVVCYPSAALVLAEVNLPGMGKLGASEALARPGVEGRSRGGYRETAGSRHAYQSGLELAVESTPPIR